MSFILDALKKSESDRQRQSGPALFEVKIAPPKARFPVWAVAIAALLGINMIIVGWLLLRRPAHGDAAATNVPAQNNAPAQMGGMQQAASPAGGQWGANGPAGGQPRSGQYGQYGSNGGQQGGGGGPPPGAQNGWQQGGPPAGLQTYPPGNANGSGGNYPNNTGYPNNNGYPNNGAYPNSNGNPNNGGGYANNTSQGQWSPPPGQQQAGFPQQNQQSGQQAYGPGAGGAAMADRDTHEPTLGGNVKDQNGGNAGGQPGGNPDDYAPAADPGKQSLFKGHVRRGTESGLPLYQDAAVVPGANIPELRLDLHVYAANPQDRFALINMHKLHEGDSTPEGVRVESITTDGVIMSHNGSKFLLPRD
jgi:hypothetical protein